MRSRNSRQQKTASPSDATSRRPSQSILISLAICVFLFAIVWIVFAKTLHYDFLNYDDDHYVYANPKITNGLTLAGIQWAFTHVQVGNWHPLTTMSHMLDCQVYGLEPWGHHLTNVLLHGLAAILLFFALQKLTTGNKSSGTVAALYERRPEESKVSSAVIDRRYSFWASAFVAALFAIHPLRVESVAWISERKDVLSGVFFMLTLLAYARYAQSERFSIGWYLSVLVLFALGLMCKPTLVTLPFILLLLDYWPLSRIRSAKGEELSGKSEGERSQRSVVRGQSSVVPLPWSVVRGRWSVVRGP